MTPTFMSPSIVGLIVNPGIFAASPVGLSPLDTTERCFLTHLQGGFIGAGIETFPVQRLEEILQTRADNARVLSPVFKRLQRCREANPTRYDAVVENVGNHVFGSGFSLFRSECLGFAGDSVKTIETFRTERDTIPDGFQGEAEKTIPLRVGSRHLSEATHTKNWNLVSARIEKEVDRIKKGAGILETYFIPSLASVVRLYRMEMDLTKKGEVGGFGSTEVTLQFNGKGTIIYPTKFDLPGLNAYQRESLEGILKRQRAKREVFLERHRFQLEEPYINIFRSVVDILRKEFKLFGKEDNSKEICIELSGGSGGKYTLVPRSAVDQAQLMQDIAMERRVEWSLYTATLKLKNHYKKGMLIHADFQYEFPALPLPDVVREVFDYIQREIEEHNANMARTMAKADIQNNAQGEIVKTNKAGESTVFLGPEEALGLPPRGVGVLGRLVHRWRGNRPSLPQTALWEPVTTSASHFEIDGEHWVFHFPKGVDSVTLGRGPEADVQIRAKDSKRGKKKVDTVSAKHVRIFRLGDSFLIGNVSKTNDVYVDNHEGALEPLVPEEINGIFLRSGALIQMGQVTFQFGGEKAVKK